MIIIDKKPLVNYFQKMNTTTKCVCAFKKANGVKIKKKHFIGLKQYP